MHNRPMTTTQQPQTFITYTRNMDDFEHVHVIADGLTYAAARQLARKCGGCVMYTDQFAAHFEPTTPNLMGGTLR